MNCTLRFVIVACLLPIASTLAKDPAPHEANGKIYVVVQEKDQPLRELALDKQTVEKVIATNTDLTPYLALSVLTVSGLDCCPPIKKLSDTVWRCCDGNKKIVTNSTAFDRMLARANEISPSQWENYKREKHIMALDMKTLDEILQRQPKA